MRTRRLLSAALLLVLVVPLGAGCARADRAPLPGDSVSADGAVELTPGRVPLAPAPGAGTAREAPSTIEGKLFSPELVMEHQGAIALTPAQHQTITKEVERAHTELLRIQWELDAEKEKLATLLDANMVDEARSKAAAAEVMKREVAIKSAHLGMLVRIKNALTADQQAQLRAIREADRCGGPRKAEPPARDSGSD
jgi:Spy/CpxP family protein refolding chaperone